MNKKAILVSLVTVLGSMSMAAVVDAHGIIGSPTITCQATAADGFWHDYGAPSSAGATAHDGASSTGTSTGVTLVQESNQDECFGAVGLWGPIPDSKLWTFTVECSDGLDNDGDGFTDAGSDPECDSYTGAPTDTCAPGTPATADEDELLDGCQDYPDGPNVADFDAEFDYGVGGGFFPDNHHDDRVCVVDDSGQPVAFTVGIDADNDGDVEDGVGGDDSTDTITSTCNDWSSPGTKDIDETLGFGPNDYNGISEIGVWAFLGAGMTIDTPGLIAECKDDVNNDPWQDDIADFDGNDDDILTTGDGDPECAAPEDDDEATPGFQPIAPGVPGIPVFGVATTGHMFTLG